MVGICNSALSEKLQLDSGLTLDTAVTQVRQSEAIKQQQPLLRGKPDTSVGAVQRARGGQRANKGSRNSVAISHKPGREQCSRCGRYPAHKKDQCPAKDQICRKCNKRGHFQVMCRSTVKVRGIQTSIGSGDNAFLGALTEESTTHDPWAITVSLEGKPVTLHIDTGAEVTIITEQMWKSVGRPEMSHPDKTLRGPDFHTISTLGKFTGTLALGTRQTEGEIYVVRGLSKSLLGRPAISDLELIKRVAAVDHNLSPKEQFSSLFQGQGNSRVNTRTS